jgi:hypothetical protein
MIRCVGKDLQVTCSCSREGCCDDALFSFECSSSNRDRRVSFILQYPCNDFAKCRCAFAMHPNQFMTLLVIADNAQPPPNASSEECTFSTETAGPILIKLRSTSIRSLANNYFMSYHDNKKFSLPLCGPTNGMVDHRLHAIHIPRTSAQQVVYPP